MLARRILGVAVACVALAASGAASAAAATAGHVVFAQTDALSANRIVAYDRAPEGSLTQLAAYPTGGLGGALEGSVFDHLASQGSLVYDRQDDLLLAVNAGSDTVSVFAVFGDQLALRQVIASGGSFPVSIAVHDGLVYVLNATEGGALAGFRVQGGRLVPLPHSERALGLNPAATPQFTTTPGQVAFSPDGSQVVVTTKGNTNAVEVFAVRSTGVLAASPTVNTLPGAVPFAVNFDRHGHLLLTEAGPSVLASFELRADGTIAQLAALPSEQAASCWVAAIGDRFFTSNTGSASVSGFEARDAGQLLVGLGRTATDAGTVDAAPTPDGRFLYVQTGGAGIIDEFALGPHGALTEVGSASIPGGAGGEGIVAP
jgi:6-phosphogluconolactonase (cycloisomerase 2 family)